MVQDQTLTLAMSIETRRSRSANGPDPGVTKVFVRKGVSITPTLRTTEVSDKDLDASAAYLARNTEPGTKK